MFLKHRIVHTDFIIESGLYRGVQQGRGNSVLCLYIRSGGFSVNKQIILFRFILLFKVSTRNCLHALMFKKHINFPLSIAAKPLSII